MQQSKVKSLAIWVVVLVLLLALLQLSGSDDAIDIAYDAFIAYVDEGQVASVRVDGNVIHFEIWGGASFQALGVMDDDLTRRLAEARHEVAHARTTADAEADIDGRAVTCALIC